MKKKRKKKGEKRSRGGALSLIPTRAVIFSCTSGKRKITSSWRERRKGIA